MLLRESRAKPLTFISIESCMTFKGPISISQRRISVVTTHLFVNVLWVRGFTKLTGCLKDAVQDWKTRSIGQSKQLCHSPPDLMIKGQ